MAKAQECALIVNTGKGKFFEPVKCKSIAEAYRKGKEAPGFAFRILVDDEIVKTGYCASGEYYG